MTKKILKVLIESDQKKWIKTNAKFNRISQAEWVRLILEKYIGKKDYDK